MSKDRAVRQEIKDRIKALPSFKGNVDKECQDLVELMRAAEISPQSSYWTDYNTALQARQIIPKSEQPKPSLLTPVYSTPKIIPVVQAPGQKYVGKIVKMTRDRQYNVRVAIKTTPRIVWVSEVYHDYARLNWGYNPEYCGTEMTHLKGNPDPNLFLTIPTDSGLLVYTPLEPQDLEGICRGLSTYGLRSQAMRIVNFGYGLCKDIVEAMQAGRFTDAPENPLSRVVHDARAWETLVKNQNRQIALEKELFLNSKAMYEFTYVPMGTGH